MTSPSRRKRQTIAQNSLRRATIDRPLARSLKQSLRMAMFGACVLSSMASELNAQQPPAWSPAAFVAPASSATTQTIPRNSLRDKAIPETQEVMRWRSPHDASHQEPAKTHVQVFESPSSPTAKTLAIDSSVSRVSSGVDTQIARPKSSFELNQTLQRSVANTSVSSQVQLASHAADSDSSNRATNNGVWYDRSEAKNSDELILGSSVGNANGPSRTKPNARKSADSHSKANQVKPVRYQQLNTDSALGILPLNLPSAQGSEQTMQPPAPSGSIMPDAMPNLDRTLNAEPPRLQDSSRPGRSLIEPEQVVPNPFPGSRAPKASDDRSPSDETEPPAMNLGNDDDRAPAPPRRLDRSTVDCDVIRKMAKETDIRKVKVDSSPVFGEGIQDERSRPKNTKDDFIANAPARNWYNHDGEVVAVGKLVDLEYGMVNIEKEDGARISILMRKLSDYDQAYVAQSWSVPITCSIDDGSFPSRDFIETTMTWKASGACHKPLYFEDVQLERYGHEWGPVAQPVISTLHFFGNVAVLPYKMGIHPMNECQYSLGYYRPGSCAPWTVGPVPLSLQGALMQAKVVTGAALALP